MLSDTKDPRTGYEPAGGLADRFRGANDMTDLICPDPVNGDQHPAGSRVDCPACLAGDCHCRVGDTGCASVVCLLGAVIV